MKIVLTSRNDLKLVVTDVESKTSTFCKVPFMRGIGGVQSKDGGILALSNSNLIQVNFNELTSNHLKFDSIPKDFKYFNGMQLTGSTTKVWADPNNNRIANVDGDSVYTPSHLDESTPADFCHVNGVEENEEGYVVTALSFDEHWRTNFNNGRIWKTDDESKFANVILPHSPVIFNNKIYVLESGTSSLLSFNMDLSGKQTVATGFTGFVRGLDIRGGKAYLATSKIREQSTFCDFLKNKEAFFGDEAALWEVDLMDGTKNKITTYDRVSDITDLCVIEE